MKWRNITPKLELALADTPVVLLNGARQTGKTTLARAVVGERAGARYYTLDDAATLGAAAGDPAGFLHGAGGLTVIDEVQKAPALFPAIKVGVDRDRRPGRFLLTGSANVLLVPSLSESLAGRMEILTLWPFSQGEIEEVREGFVDALFGEDPPLEAGAGVPPAELRERVLRGGYPEALRRSGERRDDWFASYLTAILQRDVRDLANVEGLTEMPRLLSLLAARGGALMNKAEISRAAGLPYTTLDRYLALLQMTYLFQPLPAWSANISKRLVRSPKIHLGDSGLAAHLLGLSAERLEADPKPLGALLEGFVAGELRKQATWARKRVSFFHLRTASRKEVDLVLEDRAGRLVGVEVKASSSVTARDFSGLRAFSELAGDRFLRGVVLYTGHQPISFAPDFYAVPLDALWRTAEPQEGSPELHGPGR